MAKLNNYNKITHLSLTDGIIRRLHDSGISRVAALRKMTRDQLLEIEFFGPEKVNQIKVALKKSNVPSYHMR